MAPVTGKRPLTSTRARKSSSILTQKLPRERSKDGLFGTSKKDKRIIKHSALISRIEKPKAPTKKRRRPSKKLVATLESLADALPESTGHSGNEVVSGDVKIRYTSMKSRPGAMKRKEALVNVEKERFNNNMAQMAALPAGGDTMGNGDGAPRGTSASGHKWAALRQFIQQSTERRSDAEPAPTSTSSTSRPRFLMES